MPKGPAFVGIDVGASRTKVAVLDAKKSLIGRAVRKSGTDFAASAQTCLETALQAAQLNGVDVGYAVSTGYGRRNVAFAHETKTEISCHARGCYHYFPMAITIIDIGGQDNKVIKLDGAGRRSGFKMNRKCAAGTGAFLEEMSARLDIPLNRMDDLAQQSTRSVELGSYCTVFSATEVLEKIRQGCEVPDIVKALYLSVIKRVMEMEPWTERVVVTGGVVAHNPILVDMITEISGREVLVPEHPQFTGAFGAALYAMEGWQASGTKK
jgi:predicted CoA-substrate-specific enzyme activase